MTNTSLIPRTVTVLPSATTYDDGKARYSAYATHALVPGHTATACGRFTDEEVAPYRDYKGVGIECRACQKDLAARGIAMVVVSEEGQP